MNVNKGVGTLLRDNVYFRCSLPI